MFCVICQLWPIIVVSIRLQLIVHWAKEFSHITDAFEAEIQVKFKDMRTKLKHLQKYSFQSWRGTEKSGSEPVTITEVINTDLGCSETTVHSQNTMHRVYDHNVMPNQRIFSLKFFSRTEHGTGALLIVSLPSNPHTWHH